MTPLTHCLRTRCCSHKSFLANWCNLVQLGADWCSVVQLGEDWCNLPIPLLPIFTINIQPVTPLTHCLRTRCCSHKSFLANWCNLVQLGADWCSVVQLGEDWCNLPIPLLPIFTINIQPVTPLTHCLRTRCCSHKSFLANWCNLVQLGADWCSVVQLGEDWCNLVQFGAD